MVSLFRVGNFYRLHDVIYVDVVNLTGRWKPQKGAYGYWIGIHATVQTKVRIHKISAKYTIQVSYTDALWNILYKTMLMEYRP